MVTITFATETGNAECLAEDAGKLLSKQGIENTVVDMGQMNPRDLQEKTTLLAIVSTWGDGDPPTDAEDFFFELQSLDPMNLGLLQFAVLALGDTCYDLFCQFGKDLDEQLNRHGAQRMLPRVDCDVDYEDNFDSWISELESKLARPEAAAV